MILGSSPFRNFPRKEEHVWIKLLLRIYKSKHDCACGQSILGGTFSPQSLQMLLPHSAVPEKSETLVLVSNTISILGKSVVSVPSTLKFSSVVRVEICFYPLCRMLGRLHKFENSCSSLGTFSWIMPLIISYCLFFFCFHPVLFAISLFYFC